MAGCCYGITTTFYASNFILENLPTTTAAIMPRMPAITRMMPTSIARSGGYARMSNPKTIARMPWSANIHAILRSDLEMTSICSINDES